MKCKSCDKQAVANTNGYCKQHFLEKKEIEYLDNTDPNNLGIMKWARDFLPHYLTNSTPQFHIKILLLLLNLYHPFLRNKMERLLNIVSWRGSAKSTLATMIFPSYLLAMNGKSFKIRDSEGNITSCKINERFICIVSETGELAEDFAVRIRDEFLSNRSLKYFYKVVIEDAIEERTGQLTRRAFKINGCYVLGIGSGMQIRGRIKGAYRVSFLIADDLYSEKKVKSELTRDAIRKWWNGAVKNSVDDVTGKIGVLGTILHEDTVNVDLVRNELWKTEFIRLMPLEKFNRFLMEYMNINLSSGECHLPFSDVPNEMDKIRLRRQFYDDLQAKEDWGLSWPDRMDLYLLALTIADAVRSRQLSLLYQEYLHEILPNSNKRFVKEYFQVLPEYSIIHQDGNTWFHCPALYFKPVLITIIVAIDTASGTMDGDDSAIIVFGILPDNRWIVFETIYGKFGMRDETFTNTNADLRYGKVIMDPRHIRKTGYIDEAFRLAQRYNAVKVKVGYAGNEKTLVDETRKIFSMNGSNIMVLGRRQLSGEGAKIERIQNTLHSHYSTFSVWHKKGLTKLEHQLEYLGASKEDDVADALEVAANDEHPPQAEDYKEKVELTYDPKMEEARHNAISFFNKKFKELHKN